MVCSAVTCDPARGEVTVGEDGAPLAFDAVFGPVCTQADIYDSVASPIVESALGGVNGTIFAYGQACACGAAGGRCAPAALSAEPHRRGAARLLRWTVRKWSVIPRCSTV